MCPRPPVFPPDGEWSRGRWNIVLTLFLSEFFFISNYSMARQCHCISSSFLLRHFFSFTFQKTKPCGRRKQIKERSIFTWHRSFVDSVSFGCSQWNWKKSSNNKRETIIMTSKKSEKEMKYNGQKWMECWWHASSLISGCLDAQDRLTFEAVVGERREEDEKRDHGSSSQSVFVIRINWQGGGITSARSHQTMKRNEYVG